MTNAHLNGHSALHRAVLEAALHYVEVGIPVFPVWGVADDSVHCACGDPRCASMAKHPVTLHGYQDASRDPEQIRRWWATSAHNIGLAANGTGLYPIDIDDKHGHHGTETFGQLIAGQELPETVQARTPSGGRHYYWIATDYPDYAQLKYGPDAHGDGVDVPNYIIAPPSRTPEGEYTWVPEHSLDDLKPAILPRFLAAFATDGRKAQHHNETPARADDAVSQLVRYGLEKGIGANSRDRGCFEMCLYARDTAQMSPEQAQTFLTEYVREANRLQPKDHAFTQEAAEKQLQRAYAEGRRDPPFESRKGGGGSGRHHEAREVIGLNVVTAAKVVEMPVYWLWKNYVPLRENTLFEGLPDLGKSGLTLLLAARVSRGGPMPDGTKSELDGPANVVILSCEDDAATTIVPRLRIAGADLDRVFIVKSASLRDGGTDQLQVPEDIEALRAAIAEHDAKLVIVDPLVGYISGKVNTNNDAQVRRAMTPLSEMAHDLGCAVISIRHHTKDSKQTDLLLRGGGSIGVTGSARSLLAFMRDPEDPEHSPRRYLAVGKHNLAPDDTKTLVFAMESIETEVAGVARSLPRLRYVSTDERSGRTILEALAATSSPKEGSKLHEAFEFIEQILGDGLAEKAAKVIEAAAGAGINKNTLYGCRDRLRKQGRLVIEKVGSGGEGGKGYWTWRLKPVSMIHVVDRRANALNELGDTSKVLG